MTTTEKNTTKVAAADLAPDFDNIPGDLVADEYVFWMGVTPDCPRGQIDVAGMSFPRGTERIHIDDVTGRQTRIPESGTLNKFVTRVHFEKLCEVLPRLVIRPSKVINEDGSGENIGDPIQRSKGKLIKIPDEAAIAGARENGRKLKPYVKQKGDRPATEFMYFVYAPNGVRGASYQTIAEAGLEWPAEIQAVEDFMS